LPDVVWPKEVKTSAVKKTAFPVAQTGTNLVEAEGVYPVNTPFSEKAKKHVEDKIAGFMNDYSDQNKIEDAYDVSEESSVDVFHGKKLISYLYGDWRDDGGAHGNIIFSSDTFDMNGKKYALADMFLKNADYLGAISRLATAHFVNDPDIQFDPKDTVFGTGLDPKPENFQTFTIAGNSLIFQFQQYQIGPYSDGAPTFEIPVTDPSLKKIIRSELF